MNYRQVAELICRVLGLGCMVYGLCGLISTMQETDWTVSFYGIPSFLYLFAYPLMGIFAGVALLLFSKPLGFTLVPGPYANDWNGNILAFSGAGLLLLALAAQDTAHVLLYPILENLADSRSMVSFNATYEWTYLLPGVPGVLMWLVLPRVYAWRLGRLARRKPGTDSLSSVGN